jgi:hypothetical protein
MSIKIDELVDLEGLNGVRFTLTLSRGELALPSDDAGGITTWEPGYRKQVYIEEMLHHIVLNHGHQLRGAIFEPLMEGMLEPGEDVIDPALVQELRESFEDALLARLARVAA